MPAPAELSYRSCVGLGDFRDRWSAGHDASSNPPDASLKGLNMTSILSRLAYAVLLSAMLAVPACAEEVKSGDLMISQAWSRATPGGAKVAGGYLTIENKGSAPDRLIGGSADVATKVQVHEMATSNGVMTMRLLDAGLTIEPGKTVKLAPGGYHLMML